MVQNNLLTRLFSFSDTGAPTASLQQAEAAASLQEAEATTTSLHTVEATLNNVCSLSTLLVSVYYICFQCWCDIE